MYSTYLLCTRRKLKVVLFTLICFFLLLISGMFDHALEKNFYTDFRYPYDGDIEAIIQNLEYNRTTNVSRINSYNFHFYKNCAQKCKDLAHIRLVYIVKSAPRNYVNRLAIRRSWGFQKRFSDVEIRTLFLIGLQSDATLERFINEESAKFRDIVQANYTDTYFNNTYKTMSGFEWAMTYCPNAKYFMFIDDDYYISTKNVLRFLKYPTHYPQYLKEPMGHLSRFSDLRQLKWGDSETGARLYAGYVWKSAPHRHYISKWYVPLKEYPYNMWPPYVSGGAYILSNSALTDMYHASFFTKHFRFDDIYLGILAYKTKIEPLHSKYFYFYKERYNKFNYKYVVASHGYENPEELVNVWNEQKSLGNA